MNAAIATERLDLVPMTAGFLRSTIARDTAAAERQIGLVIPPDWYGFGGFAAIRLRDLEVGTTYAPWLPRAIGLRATGEMVGFIGFHTPPAPAYLQELCPGGVEFGYTIFPAFRRRGFAIEASRGLMRWAHETMRVPVFVVSVSPANTASLALIAKLGFRRIGAHVDEQDGPEDVFAWRPGLPERGRGGEIRS